MIFSPEVGVVAFGLLASASWGAGDFSGGLATRKQSVISVLLLAHLVGLVLFLGLAILGQETMPPLSDLTWGALAGLSGAVGLGGLYSALASGRMGLAAPMVGVIAAIIPVIVSILSNGVPTAIQIVGFAVGIISLWLVSYSGGQLPARKILILAFVAGLGFGGFFVLVDRVQSSAVFWPLSAARAASFAAMLTITIVSRRPALPKENRQWVLIALSGALDALANAFFVVASQLGRLDIASILSSLYPAMTVMLAWLFLNERLTRIQIVGILAALVAIALISLPSK
jgi:drug/metabolite transporter (DMT)-like permease